MIKKGLLKSMLSAGKRTAIRSPFLRDDEEYPQGITHAAGFSNAFGFSPMPSNTKLRAAHTRGRFEPYSRSSPKNPKVPLQHYRIRSQRQRADRHGVNLPLGLLSHNGGSMPPFETNSWDCSYRGESSSD
jgi:hypothetical protein